MRFDWLMQLDAGSVCSGESVICCCELFYFAVSNGVVTKVAAVSGRKRTCVEKVSCHARAEQAYCLWQICPFCSASGSHKRNPGLHFGL